MFTWPQCIPNQALVVANRRQKAQMFKAISLSVLTQALAAGGSFIVSILILRTQSLELFGWYVYFQLFAGCSSVVVNAACEVVYHAIINRYHNIKYVYEKNYNSFHLIILFTTTTPVIILCLVLSRQLITPAMIVAISMFILAVTGVDSFKLQATANGRYTLMFRLELLRQTTLLGAIGIISWRGNAQLSEIMLAQGLTGLLVCAGIMIGIGWSLSFKRLGWVARRHFRHARHLVPGELIFASYGLAIGFLVAHQFGPQALGVLRSAELPFNAINPLKSSLIYFMPQAIHQAERGSPIVRRQFLMKSRVILLLVFLVIIAIWAISIPAFPLLSKKEYPAAIGIICAVTYFAFMAIGLLEIYFNGINKSQFVFNQKVLGSVSALTLFISLAPAIGYIAAPVATSGSWSLVVLYGLTKLVNHWRRTSDSAAGHANAAPSSPT